MLNLKNTLDGYLKNVEVIGNTIQDENNLADIRSVGDKVEGQELYKIPVVSCGKNLNNTTIKRGNINTNTGIEVSGGNTILCTSDFVKANPLIKYTLSSNMEIGSPLLTCYDKDKVYLGFCNIYNGYFETKENTKYIKFRFKKYNNEEFTDLEVSNINIQFEEGTQATPYEPYQENKLEILSPVQLEKVGDVADRIICKNGVWGVEKHINSITLGGSEHWVNEGTGSSIDIMFGGKTLLTDSFIAPATNEIKHLSFPLAPKRHVHWSSPELEGIHLHPTTKGVFINVLVSKLENNSLDSFKKWLQLNPQTVKYQLMQPQFIPLPQDQQVKLRTFAGQTNIAFLTEIAGQIKAQVPKSLGATVNTHTEQITDLHNSLERVKKLEETTVSTVETERNFTTVDATSNGYFEDVKLEGKTLVNLCGGGQSVKEIGISFSTPAKYSYSRTLSPNTTYTLVCNILGVNSELYSKLNYSVNGGNIGVVNVLRNGVNVIKFTTNSTVNYESLWIYYNQSESGYGFNTEGTVSNVVILEGDHTNNLPEYFEGLMSVGQDVEEVSVESRNSNLFNAEQHIPYGVSTSMEMIPNTNYRSYYINCEPNTSYFVRSNCSGNRFGVGSGVILQNNGYTFKLTDSYVSKGSDAEYADEYTIFRTGEHDKYLFVYVTNNGVFNEPIIHIEKSTEFVEYKDVKYNKKPLLYFNPTTETWEKPVLREWDSIEKHSDSKYYYHKRSEEVVLNGSENWEINPKEADILQGLLTISNADTLIINDKFKYSPHNDVDECIWIYNKSSMVLNVSKSRLSTQDVAGFKAWLKANPTTVVYQLAQEEVYECTNIDLMTYSDETNYIVNSGAISPKSILKVHNNISNVVKILQEKVNLLENTFIAGLKSVLSGDMYSLATILYPEDFEQNDNTEQDIMVIPE